MNMWQHDQTTVTDEELLQTLKETIQGSITVLDGPTGCGKTRLLKQLAASEGRSVDKYSVEAIKELVMGRIYSSPHIQRDMTGDDIIAIEDIDFLNTAKSLQIEAAILIEKASAEHAVIITGIQLSKRVPVMMKTLERHCDNLLVWKYQS